MLVAFLCAGGAWAGSFRVLILIGDARTQEPPLVEANAKAGVHSLEFEQVIIEGGELDGDMRGAYIVYFPLEWTRTRRLLLHGGVGGRLP